MSGEEKIKNACRNMIQFRHDQHLYIFWRNVWREFRRRYENESL